VIRKEGYAHVLHPFVIERGVDQKIEIKVPRTHQVPEGFVFVPEGPFLVGSPDEQLRTGFLDAEPLHQRSTRDYLIGRDEVTIADWLEFVEALPPNKRTTFLPVGREPGGARLEVIGQPGQWTFRLTSGNRATQASWGEQLVYSKLRSRPIDWSRLPVSGVSYDDTSTFIDWYSKRRRIRGLRLCTEDEWEKAARGADGREFPHGDAFARGDANVDITWDKDPQSLGPDAVGSYPKTTSPFGLRDVCGNVNELVHGREGAVVRGGSFWHGVIAAKTSNRTSVPDNLRAPAIGLRLCAPVQDGAADEN
jgi:formylglycine-generating enzyme required for sulfatase activity